MRTRYWLIRHGRGETTNELLRFVFQKKHTPDAVVKTFDRRVLN